MLFTASLRPRIFTVGQPEHEDPRSQGRREQSPGPARSRAQGCVAPGEKAPAAASPVMPAIRCSSLAKRYGDVVAVAGLDLTVETGECFGLLGPNGAGKTTTIEILEGLTLPDAGEVEVLGVRWGTGHDRALRQRLGIQLQETQLADKLTVEETLRLFRSFYRDSQAVDDVLALVELEEKRGSWVNKLSGGQKQRLAVACALVSRPEFRFSTSRPPVSTRSPAASCGTWSPASARAAAACS